MSYKHVDASIQPMSTKGKHQVKFSLTLLD